MYYFSCFHGQIEEGIEEKEKGNIYQKNHTKIYIYYLLYLILYIEKRNRHFLLFIFLGSVSILQICTVYILVHYIFFPNVS